MVTPKAICATIADFMLPGFPSKTNQWQLASIKQKTHERAKIVVCLLACYQKLLLLLELLSFTLLCKKGYNQEDDKILSIIFLWCFYT